MIRVWLFDIDGTLIRSGGAGQDAALEALQHAFELDSVSRHEVAFAGRTDRAIIGELFRLHGIEWNDLNWNRFQVAYTQRLGDALLRREGEVIQGVWDLLARISAQHQMSLGLLTGNIREGAKKKLTHFGMWQHFAFGGFGDRHESRDDVAVDALADAERHLGQSLDRSQVCVVGDTVHDIRCARAIGVHAVAVATGSHSHEQLAAESPDLLLDDLQPSASLERLFEVL